MRKARGFGFLPGLLLYISLRLFLKGSEIPFVTAFKVYFSFV